MYITHIYIYIYIILRNSAVPSGRPGEVRDAGAISSICINN